MADPTWHNENGKFKPGNPGGPGRPPLPELPPSHLQALTGAVTPDDWTEIVTVQKARAMRGNLGAAKWIGEYVMSSADTRYTNDPVGFITVEKMGDKGYWLWTEEGSELVSAAVVGAIEAAGVKVAVIVYEDVLGLYEDAPPPRIPDPRTHKTPLLRKNTAPVPPMPQPDDAPQDAATEDTQPETPSPPENESQDAPAVDDELTQRSTWDNR